MLEDKMLRWGYAALAALVVSAGAAQAAQQTLAGTQFDVIYDDTKLGLFGTPTLAGNVLFFTPNAFSAESTNGAELVTSNSTLSGLVLVAKPGFNFSSVALGEIGDYRLIGAGSAVDVSGRLIAFDVDNSLQTLTSAALTVTSGPLTLADGQLHDWQASASVTNASTSKPPLPTLPPLTGWLDDASRVGLTIENLLYAYTEPGVTPSLAFIEKKFSGVQLTVSVVPEPGTWAAMMAGLLLVGARVGSRGRK
jgi:hypothetical protein